MSSVQVLCLNNNVKKKITHLQLLYFVQKISKNMIGTIKAK